MTRGRKLEQRQQTRLARAMRDEDRARAGLREVLRRRDAVIRETRWGLDGCGGVMPDEIRKATRSIEHPDGLSRFTIHRAAGEPPTAATA